jgi:AcrR family transcriptional regulator
MKMLSELPLRQRKQAQTKLAILRATLERLDDRPLEAIPTRELCEAANISEATFFNYFPKKSDIVVFYIQYWSLDLGWKVANGAPDASAFEAIEFAFLDTARQLKQHPGIMREIIAFQARLPHPLEAPPMTVAERVVAFPERAGIDTVPAAGLDSLLPPLIERAKQSGELPRTIDTMAAFLGLASLFFGVFLCLAQDPSIDLVEAYRSQLKLYWAGLEAAG